MEVPETTAAKEAILNGEIVELEVFDWVKITFEYIDMPNVMNILKKHQLKMVDNTFEVSCELTTNLPLDMAGSIKNELESNETVKIESKGIY